MPRPLVKVSGQFPQPTIIKKSSLSHRIAIQQHGMRGSIISILPADEMGYFCISQAYTRSLWSIPGALGGISPSEPRLGIELRFATPQLEL